MPPPVRSAFVFSVDKDEDEEEHEDEEGAADTKVKE
jgi:hypothetical protein